MRPEAGDQVVLSAPHSRGATYRGSASQHLTPTPPEAGLGQPSARLLSLMSLHPLARAVSTVSVTPRLPSCLTALIALHGDGDVLALASRRGNGPAPRAQPSLCTCPCALRSRAPGAHPCRCSGTQAAPCPPGSGSWESRLLAHLFPGSQAEGRRAEGCLQERN